MARSSREVFDIDEQTLLNSIAEEGCKRQLPVQSIQTIPVDNTAIGKPEAECISDEMIEPTNNAKRMSGKQRKLALEEFRQQFMRTPRIENRKPVFISETIRDDMDRIVRLFGERGLSVSGLLENLVRHFLETYKDDVEQWRKM
jgi:hypothetical protein